MQKLISEVLDEADKLKTNAARMTHIRENFTPAIQMLIEGGTNPDLKFALPSARPEFRVNEKPIGLTEDYLVNATKKFYIFTADHATQNPGMKQLNRERKFIELLEGLHKGEAELVCQMIEKKFKYPWLTFKFYKTCFGV